VIRARFAAWRQKRRCRRGKHAWTSTTAAGDGSAVAIVHCRHCPKVDVDRIVTTVWNRRTRRAARRATTVARSLRRRR
jgi:hypothetical protein